MSLEDGMKRYQLTGPASEVVVTDGSIKMINAINGTSAVLKYRSKDSKQDDFAVGGNYATGAGLTMLPTEQRRCNADAITVTSGTVEYFVGQNPI